MLWRPYRFKPGDRVACNCGERGFMPGTVLERNILQDLEEGEEAPAVAAPPGKKLRAAYAVRLEVSLYVYLGGIYRYRLIHRERYI